MFVKLFEANNFRQLIRQNYLTCIYERHTSLHDCMKKVYRCCIGGGNPLILSTIETPSLIFITKPTRVTHNVPRRPLISIRIFMNVKDQSALQQR